VSEQAYIQALRNLYIQLPHTSGRFSRSDRQLAADLFQRQIPFDIVRSAMLLAIAHRLYRKGPPLSTIRSLHYFLPVINEIIERPLPGGYVAYLENKIAALK
jgi:hypothetical protein